MLACMHERTGHLLHVQSTAKVVCNCGHQVFSNHRSEKLQLVREKNSVSYATETGWVVTTESRAMYISIRHFMAVEFSTTSHVSFYSCRFKVNQKSGIFNSRFVLNLEKVRVWSNQIFSPVHKCHFKSSTIAY